jgi:hypothetical protein
LGTDSFSPVNGTTGSYSVTGTPANVTSALEALVFTPTEYRLLPGTTENTTFTIHVDDGLGGTASDANTVVRTKAIDTLPTLNAAGVTGLTTPDTTPISPFAAVTVADPDAGATLGSAQTVTLTIKLDQAVKGTLSDSAYSGAAVFTAETGSSAGTYTIVGSAADVQAALRATVFTPTENRIPLSSSGEVSVFTLSLVDSTGGKAASTATVAVIVTPVEDDPTGPIFSPTALTAPVSSGKLVGTLSAGDPDGTTDTYTYALVSGSGDEDNADFVLGTGAKGNQLFVATGQTLTAGTYNILAQVTDSKGNSSQQALTVTVN